MNHFKAPKHIRRTTSTTVYNNRGVRFEDMINRANEYYRTHNVANIHKKPTPIQIVNVSYPKRSAAKITEAYFKTPSTTDYNGIYRGYYIDFEAKETNNKTTFPLANIYQHQLDHLFDVVRHGGISFLLISFTKIDRYFLLPASKIYTLENDVKQLKLEYFQDNGYEINNSNSLYLNYLAALDVYLQEENTNEYI